MTDTQPAAPTAVPENASAALVLADGTVFWGTGLGAEGHTVGEVCFNTGMTGYQEVLTDPSYAGQIITFTFPHIGNVGANGDDIEATTPAARGLVLKTDITSPSNFRSQRSLDTWLVAQNIVGIAGVDTRALTRAIRRSGAPTGVLAHNADGRFDLEALAAEAREWPGLEGMDLASTVSCTQRYDWTEQPWTLATGHVDRAEDAADRHIVAIDYGVKRNILRNLSGLGCRVTVVPAATAAADILALKPDGIFLSNGPGDPAATGAFAVPIVRELVDSAVPLFGICLGHQILALAIGATTTKMKQGHRGANHPVKDLQTGKVEITSQNHGFVVRDDSLPDNVEATHISLFDGSLEGLRLTDRPVFSVQYHPEASPGPQDSHYLFVRFLDMIKAARP